MMVRKRLILDRYEPLGVAGSGGFGTVRIAWDPRIQRKVAIKTIELTEYDAYRAGLPGAQAVAAASPEGDELSDTQALSAEIDEADYGHVEAVELVTALARVPGLDEARTAAKLSDPRIVAVYDFEVRDRTAYLIMEYVEGITLTKLLREYSDFLTLDMVTSVFDAVAGALAAAHGAGVLHLDIKPDNILIDSKGQAKVTDFGLATLADASGAGTTGGGTIGYMPLEQMRREHLDARADEWSLAAVTYEMLTGDNQFRARSLEGAERAILDAELVLPSLCWESIDSQIDDVVFYALDPDRDERYANVRDFAEEADKFLGDPVRGRKQLALVVTHALEPEEDEEAEPDEAPEDGASEPKRRGLFGWFGLLRSGGRGLRRAGSNAPGARGAVGAGDDDDVAGEGFEVDALGEYEPGEPASPQFEEPWQDGGEDGAEPYEPYEQRELRPHMALSERVPVQVKLFAAHVFGALTSGFFAFFAYYNIEAISSAFGSWSIYAVAVAALVVVIIGSIRPSIGALVSFCLLGVSIILCGHPVVGGVLIAATALWFYIAGREGDANANVALLLPLVGSIGGSSAVPFACGAVLKPVQAGVTAAFSVVLAVVLASLGSGTLLGWDALSHWSFSQVDITLNMVNVLVLPSTWTIAGAWIVAAVALSLLSLGGRRWSTLLGVAVAFAIVLGGSLVYAAAVPELFVSTLAAAVVLAVVM